MWQGSNMRLTKHKYNDDIAISVLRLLTNNNRLVGKVILTEGSQVFVWVGDKKTHNAVQVNVTTYRKNIGFLWDGWYSLKIATAILYTMIKRNIKKEKK